MSAHTTLCSTQPALLFSLIRLLNGRTVKVLRKKKALCSSLSFVQKLSVGLCVIIAVSQKALGIEFTTNMLDVEDRENINLSNFENSNHIPPGDYVVRLTLNHYTIQDEARITYLPAQNDTGSQLCLPHELVQRLALKAEYYQQLLKQPLQANCLLLDTLKDITVINDRQKGELKLSVPQSLLAYADTNWMPPEQWDQGIPGLFLDYDIAGNYLYRDHDTNTRTLTSYGTVGANLEKWRLRANYQYAHRDNAENTTKRFDWTQVYLYRPLPDMSAKLLIGQNFLQSNVFDAFRFTGLSLTSDERMMPPNLRGYAPLVTGIAKTNARVTISQQGRVIYETSVPPGPFAIEDLNQAIQGMLDIAVEEEEGSTQHYQMNTATIPFLTRYHQVNYKFAAGKPTYGIHNKYIGPEFITGEFSWGMTNTTSLYGGIIGATENYNAQSLGLGHNLYSLGALSYDVTRSQARLADRNKDQTGYSYRFNYAKRFESTGSQVTFAGYRFSDRNYLSMSEYIDHLSNARYRPGDKQTYTIMANQEIPFLDVVSYLSFTRRTYWDDSRSNNLALSLSRQFNVAGLKNLTGTLSLSQNRYPEQNDTQLFLGISLPISRGQQIGFDSQFGRAGNTHNISYFNATQRDRSWRLSAGGKEHDFSHGEPLVRGNYQQQTPSGRLSLSASHKNQQYRSVNADWTGSLTLTPKGAAMGPYIGGNEPRMIISADGTANIPLNNGRAVTNRWGVAVLPGGGSYETAEYAVDVRNLPEDVDISHSVIKNTLMDGAIGYRQIKAQKGYQILAIIRLKDGSYPAFGSRVYEKETLKELGIISEKGEVFLTGINPNNTILAQLNNNQQCEIKLPTQLKSGIQQLLLPCTLSSTHSETKES